VIGNVLSWIVFGALAGWIASMISRTDERGGPEFRAVILGIVGALLGGLFVFALSGSVTNGLNVAGLLMAVFGAATLISIYKTIGQQNER
jgi:uncharacterized membrane protein YeaQ/YmgE (transglycosylase-associated protein family)